LIVQNLTVGQSFPVYVLVVYLIAEAFWNELSPEKAFLIRVFVEHCINTKDDRRLESSLPVVTALAFKIQAAYNDLLEQIQAYEELRLPDEHNDQEQEANEEARADQEFVIDEMLRLAVNLDYADEIGRRKMFGLVRTSHGTLPYVQLLPDAHFLLQVT
jgi:condensin complex subunit 3